MKQLLKNLTVLALLFITLGGCAVLTIDVDVYKGPLANSEKIQTEEVAAIAMGMRPLLFQLRAILEDLKCEGDHSKDSRCKPEYNGNDIERFKSERAKRVHAILGLYEPVSLGISDRFLEGMLVDLRPKLTDFDNAVANWRATLNVQETKHIPPSPLSIEEVQRIYESKNWPNELDNYFKKLRDKNAIDLQTMSWRLKLATKAYLTPKDPITHDIQRALKSEEVLWTALQQLLSSAEFRKRAKEEYPTLVRVLADLSGILTSPDALRRAMSTKPPKYRGTLHHLRETNPKLKSPDKIDQPDYDKLQSIIADGLQSDDGASLAEEMLEKHQAHRNTGEGHGLARTFVGYPWQFDEKISPDNSTGKRLMEAIRLTQLVGLALAKTGLERGREPLGIAKRIENYLEAKEVLIGVGDDDHDGAKKREKNARQKLTNTLIHFAEKVLALANNAPLLEADQPKNSDAQTSQKPANPETTKQYIRLLQAIGNSIIVQIDNLQKWDDFNDNVRDNKDIELAGLRNARLVGVGPVMQEFQEALVREKDFPEQAQLQEPVRLGREKVDEVITKLGTFARVADEQLAAHAAAWDRMEKSLEILRSGTMRESVLKNQPSPIDPTGLKTALSNWLTEKSRDLIARGNSTSGQHYADANNDLNASTPINLPVSEQSDKLLKYWLADIQSKATEKGNAVEAGRKAAETLRYWEGRLSVAKLMELSPEQAKSLNSAKDVTDTLLAALRYEHIALTKQYGSDHPKTKAIAAAIELNYAYRSGMVYIRPASMYLRNSYPATVLQNDSNTLWRNLLTDFGNRSLISIFCQGCPTPEQSIQNTIDKQYWQNVNRIRLSGVGDTNYAVVKDDVGNWYIKSYAANAEKLVDSIKGLALFNAGPQFGAELLNPAPASDSTTGSKVSSNAGRTTLEKQIGLVAGAHETSARDVLTSVINDAKNLGLMLNAAIRKEPEAGSKVADLLKIPPTPVTIESGIEAWPKDKSKSVSAIQSKTREVLSLAKAYRDKLTVDLNKQRVTPDAGAAAPLSDKEANAGQKAIDDTVRQLLEPAIGTSKSALAEYERMLLFIGKSAGLGPVSSQ
jgi:hypothetical protein